MAAVCRVVGHDNSSKFELISQKFSSLAYGRSEGDRHIVNSLLDDLNALDFSHTVVTNVNKAVLIINQCCSLVPPNDTFLVAKGCHLISNLVEKQSVVVEGPTLSVAVQWCLQALKQCPSVASQDVLAALEVLLKGNGTKVQDHNQTIVAALSPLLHIDASQDVSLSSPWDIHLAALRCLEALSAPPADVSSIDSGHLQPCLKVFLSQLCLDKQQQQDDINFSKVLLSSLRGVENVVSQLSNSGSIVGDAVGIVKAYMLFGLPGHVGLKPSRVLPASVPVSDLPPSTNRGQRSVKGVGSRMRSTRKKATSGKKKSEAVENEEDEPVAAPTCQTGADAVWFRPAAAAVADPQWRTSDSDFSDTEGGQAARLRSQQARVRQAALQLLLTITKVTERRIMFGYWWSLLPDGPHAHVPNARTLITCLLRDPSPRCRTAVLNVLWTMLTGSRAYLQQAEHGDCSGSFIPFSVSLGNMLRELHRSLSLALAAEGSVLALTQLLRVVAALVQNTPYHRLQPGLLTKTVRSVRGLTMHKDVNVQVAALTVLGAVVAVQPAVEELSSCLMRPRARFSLSDGNEAPLSMSVPTDGADIGSEEEIELDAEEAEMLSLSYSTNNADGKCNRNDLTLPQSSITCTLPWVLELCLLNLGSGEATQGSKSSIAAAPVRVESLQVVGALASCHFETAIAPNISLVQCALESSLQDPDESIRLHSARATEMVVLAMQNTLKAEAGPKVSFENILSFWRELLRGSLTALVQNPDQAPLRAAACDCLANIGTDVFEKLLPEQQILSFTLLFGCAGDEESLVRASAIRALGLFILFPCLRKDIQFTLDAAEAVIQALKDDSQVVRTKASWSLGNLCDALVLNRSEALEEIPDEILFELLEASIAASSDNDKVRSNGVRAVGNLLRLISASALKKHSSEVIDRAVNALTRCASCGSNMKVRWNACYAMGNLLKNSALYEHNLKCQAAIFTVLNGLVQNFRNFKVRINAALALGIPSQRSLFGHHFIAVWAALLAGLDNSEHIADFSEYKHRDALLDQICCSLCHVASLITMEDLLGIYDELLLHQDSLQIHLRRMVDSVVPERASVFLNAANHLNVLAANSKLNASQLNAAQALQILFSHQVDSDSFL